MPGSVQQGPRGGKYIQLSNGKRYYLKPGQTIINDNSGRGTPHGEDKIITYENAHKYEVKKGPEGKVSVKPRASSSASPSASSSSRSLLPHATDDDFVARVHGTAKSLIGRQHEETSGEASRSFGDDKAFVHAVHEHGGFNMPLGQFKDRLLQLHKARKLTLSRADLVEAMLPTSVSKSEITNGNASYHFVRLP